MKLSSLRTLFPLIVAATLAACGGADQDSGTFQTTTTLSQVVVVPVGAGAAAPAAAAAPAMVAANMPQPDCAADGCKRPRIIDGNAEAYRLDAMRRAQAEGGNPQS